MNACPLCVIAYEHIVYLSHLVHTVTTEASTALFCFLSGNEKEAQTSLHLKRYPLREQAALSTEAIAVPKAAKSCAVYFLLW